MGQRARLVFNIYLIQLNIENIFISKFFYKAIRLRAFVVVGYPQIVKGIGNDKIHLIDRYHISQMILTYDLQNLNRKPRQIL